MLAALIGAVVTLAVEIVFHAIYHSDEVMDGMDVRLEHIEDLMEDYAANRPFVSRDCSLARAICRGGRGSACAANSRAGIESQFNVCASSALVSLTGRSVDFAAALSTHAFDLRLRQSSNEPHSSHGSIAEIRQCLRTKKPPSHPENRSR